MTIDRVAAFRRERAAVLSFCGELSPAQWRADSAAAGWRVQDTVAHMGASCRALFTPAALTLITTKDIERANEDPVDARRGWQGWQVLAEYERWSGRALRAASIVARTPARHLRMRLGELGSFEFGVTLPGAMVFDHHLHLRHDIAPALGLAVPETDSDRMTVVIEWMLAVFSNQLKAHPPSWLRDAVDLELRGDGGGRWRIHPDGALTVARGSGAPSAVHSSADNFPLWATTRIGWRDADVELVGDRDQLTTLLDSINIV